MRVNKFLVDHVVESDSLSLEKLEKMSSDYVNRQRESVASGNSIAPPDRLGVECIIHMLRINPNGIMRVAEDGYLNYPYFRHLLLSCINDSCTSATIMIYRKYMKSPCRFVFSDGFYKELHKTSLLGARYSDLVSGSGTVKLPFKLVDSYGDMFDEFTFFVGSIHDYFEIPKDSKQWELFSQDRQYAQESYMFGLCWRDHRKSWNYVCQYCSDPDTLIIDMFKNIKFKSRYLDNGDNPIIKEEVQDDGYEAHIRSMFNCLLYLKSGDPDLRKMRNEIKYRGNSQKPVNKDRDLSQHDFTVVGFGYKKSPNYTKDIFYQPPYWARRGLLKKWTWCKGSIKKRKNQDNEIIVAPNEIPAQNTLM